MSRLDTLGEVMSLEGHADSGVWTPLCRVARAQALHVHHALTGQLLQELLVGEGGESFAPHHPLHRVESVSDLDRDLIAHDFGARQKGGGLAAAPCTEEQGS